MTITKWKEALAKAAIVLIPTYSMAYFTEKMVWVVPTLAAAGFFAGTISFSEEDQRRKVEEDSEDFDTSDVQDIGLDEDGSS